MSSYAKMTVADLKAELKKKGLDTNGLKKDLVERLEASGETANPEKEEKEEKAAPKKAATRGKKRKAEEVEEEEDEDPAPSKEEARHEAATKKFKVDNSSKKAPSSVPVDSVCQRKHPHTKSAHVYIDGDVVWGVMLNQTNISQNNNKYYVIQVLENGGSYYTYNRWGRVGDDGQDSLGGPMGLTAAKKDFEKKFKDKTKNSWDDGAARTNFTKFNGKYDLLEMDFGDDEPASAVVEKTSSGKKAVVKPCTLDTPTQALVRLICDNDMFKQQLVTFNIDVKRMPLGKLSKEQLAKGFEVLEELMEEVKAGKTSNCEKLSSRFYTVIPHEYSRSQVPPVLKQQEAIQEKMNMLEVLGDIVIAQSMLKDVDAGNSEEVDHPLDANYKKIGNELTTLNHNSKEYKIIEKYFENTKTQGSNAKLLDVWTLDRKGEKKRADKYKDVVNRKLLWHGTKVAVMVAILRDGLRIMPHSGGRVGRGIYSASENAKSAGYVGTAMDQGKNIGLMFLNEVILGTEHHIKQDDSSLISAPKGCHSVIALGRREPDSKDDVTIDGEWHPITVPAGKAVNTPHTASSFFNTEYLVYDEAQVRQKYLLKIQF